MKLKKMLTSNSSKTYFKSERTHKIKNKVKKLKNVIEEEAKNTIDKSKRRQSVYAPLEENNAEQKTEALASEVKFKNKKRKSIAPESDPTESIEVPVENLNDLSGTEKKKKHKKKMKNNKPKKDEKNIFGGKKTEKSEHQETSPANDEMDVDLDTSATQPLLSVSQDNCALRTIYIGNVPVKFKKKKLLKMLKPYGNVEKMWTRGAKPASALPKKVALITNKLAEDHPPLIVHVSFKTAAEAHTALKLNGEMYDENRLRVTMSLEKDFDVKKGVFVGNLPFNVKDEDLFNMFEQCGEIIGVRVIRDSKYGVGKGFGYVNFKSIDSVELALNLNEEKIHGRAIRVKRLFSPGQKKKMDKKKEKLSLKTGSKGRLPFSKEKSKSISTTEKKPKKKNKLSVTELKKKILAKKLLKSTKKKADS